MALVFSLLLATMGLGEICQDFAARLQGGPVALVPVGDTDGARQFVLRLSACLAERGVPIAERTGLAALNHELALNYAAGDTTAVEALAKRAGVERLVLVEVVDDGGGRTVNARIVSVRRARVEHTATARGRTPVTPSDPRIGIGLATVLPGAGHLYLDEPAVGYSVMALEGFLAAGAFFLHREGRENERRYGLSLPSTVDDGARASERYRQRDTLLWVLLGVHLAQLTHVVFAAPRARSQPESGSDGLFSVSF